MGWIGGYCTTAFATALKEPEGGIWSRQSNGNKLWCKVKNKADMRERETTYEVSVVQVAGSPSEVAQVQRHFASGRWSRGLQQGSGSCHHPKGSFGGAQPACPLSSWHGENIHCSMGNPWLSHQATTRQGVQGVPGGTALSQRHQERIRGGCKCSMGLPTENCKTSRNCWRTSRSSNEARSDTEPGCGQGWKGKANSGACQGTTVPKQCWLCHTSTAPSPGTGFHLSCRPDDLQVKKGKVQQGCMYHLLPFKHHCQELSHLGVPPCL